MALEKARRHAKDDIGIVARGGDPLSDKDAARDAVTVATVAEKFLGEYVMPRKKPSTLRLYRLAIDVAHHAAARHDPDCGREPRGRREAPRPAPGDADSGEPRAGRAVEAAGMEHDEGRYRPAGPNPCHGIEKFEERRRKRYLDADEYARLGQALRTAAIQPDRAPPSSSCC